MKTTIRALSIASLALATLGLTCLPAHAEVKGKNARHAECWKNGQLQITFDEVRNTVQWVEHNQNGAVDNSWRRAQRDEWSVYLSKAGVDLQLDLHTKKCAWNAAGHVTQYNLKNAR